jgi:polyhydroxyalkanoate synthase
MTPNGMPADNPYAAWSQRVLSDAAEKLGLSGDADTAATFARWMHSLQSQGVNWQSELQSLWQQQLALWQRHIDRQGNTGNADGTVSDAAADRRFRAPEWREPYYDYLANAYLLNARWLTALADNAQVDGQARQKLAFYTRQMVDALSPANYPWSNPEAIKLAAQTEGDSLEKGLRNLAADMGRGMVSMTDFSAFEVGRNLAVTPGAVVYENDFMQLIQYEPCTDTVHALPLVMVPPCINKYYILDLQPDNSLVRHSLEAGHTVFMVSWRNMPPSMGKASWDDYLEHGVLRAINTAKAVCGIEQVNTLGFCVGGTLLGCALAILRARGDSSVASATLLTTMLDFSDTGELGIFIDDAYVDARKTQFVEGGVLPGRELALTFASLRANDLIWPYVVNNYLKGRTPEPFDLLYWNSDSTNLPGCMYVEYIRNTYLDNRLREPGALTMLGVPVDLGRIDMPLYVLAAREDHIVPWKTAYASARLLRGPLRFVLVASGHIAGVINPAQRKRRNFWQHDALPDDPDSWFSGATSVPGSWWPDWTGWLTSLGGPQVPARACGSMAYPTIEAAPGRYVQEKTGP